VPAGVQVDYDDVSITENTRASYPIEAVSNAHIPCVGPHPKNIILLCCDAFGVLPPVARLTHAQAMYHFISGYTAKVAGTEVGVTEPSATFSACFGGAFLVWHPMKYAAMLAEKMQQHGTAAWLVNTGWTGGAYGVGSRMSLKHTRKIIDNIHSGDLAKGHFYRMPSFGFQVPLACSGVPSEVLHPRSTWADGDAYDATLLKLARLFQDNMAQYTDTTHTEAALVEKILAAGPSLAPPSSVDSVLSDEDIADLSNEGLERIGSLKGQGSCSLAAGASQSRLDLFSSRSGLA
jgi:phosphoenolpyruvate carboxykinase (ATP)